jgi:outer membrane biogenesis lipoprotein LolB
VQGALAPGAVVQAVERDEHGRLAALAQDGWRIAYVYEPPEERDSALRRLVLGDGSTEVRLVIDGWRRNGDAP